MLYICWGGGAPWLFLFKVYRTVVHSHVEYLLGGAPWAIMNNKTQVLSITKGSKLRRIFYDDKYTEACYMLETPGQHSSLSFEYV